MASCCTCSGGGGGAGKSSLPLICLVPGAGSPASKHGSAPQARPAGAGSGQNDFQLLDEAYIKKNFKLPPRALYLDPFRRPLITFPMTQEQVHNFNMSRKCKINQQILDGFLDSSEAISAPSVFAFAYMVLHLRSANRDIAFKSHVPVIYLASSPFKPEHSNANNPAWQRGVYLLQTYSHEILPQPYGKTSTDKRKEAEEDEEIIYILQLPDWETQCPVHNQTIKTPRFIWHSCKKQKGGTKGELKRGGGPLNKPKPWLLSRHTDFDLLSQW